MSLRESDVAHHLQGSGVDGEADARGSGRDKERGGNGLLTHLRSKWTVEEVGRERTRVALVVEYAFANPLYAALSGGVADKVAEFMVKAFERRVKEVLEGDPRMVGAGLGELDGSRLRRR